MRIIYYVSEWLHEEGTMIDADIRDQKIYYHDESKKDYALSLNSLVELYAKEVMKSTRTCKDNEIVVVLEKVKEINHKVYAKNLTISCREWIDDEGKDYVDSKNHFVVNIGDLVYGIKINRNNVEAIECDLIDENERHEICKKIVLSMQSLNIKCRR